MKRNTSLLWKTLIFAWICQLLDLDFVLESFVFHISKFQNDFETKCVALICVSMSFIKVILIVTVTVTVTAIVIVILILIVIVMGDAVLVTCQFMFITMHAFISLTCLFLIHHQPCSSHPAPWWCAELRAGQPKSEALSLDERGNATRCGATLDICVGWGPHLANASSVHKVS